MTMNLTSKEPQSIPNSSPSQLVAVFDFFFRSIPEAVIRFSPAKSGDESSAPPSDVIYDLNIVLALHPRGVAMPRGFDQMLFHSPRAAQQEISLA